MLTEASGAVDPAVRVTRGLALGRWSWGRAVVRRYRCDPEVRWQLVHVLAAGGALLVALRREGRRIDLSAFERDRARVEHVIGDLVAVLALLGARRQRIATVLLTRGASSSTIHSCHSRYPQDRFSGGDHGQQPHGE